MNLFDMTNPKKAEEAKILEAKQEEQMRCFRVYVLPLN